MSNRTVALVGAPNVGKSTVFNELTGMNRHTGNWIGKTVDVGNAGYYYKYNDYTVVDLPGTYSLDPVSEEEHIARDYIVGGNADVVVCVVDCTLIERSLPLVFSVLEITPNVVLMLNLCDEARKRGITVDTKMLSHLLGVPVVTATARSGRGINSLLEQVHLIATGAVSLTPVRDNTLPYIRAKAIANAVVTADAKPRESLLDRILMGRVTSVFAMIIMLGIVLWLTVSVSSYPSELLKTLFDNFENNLASFLADRGVSDTVISLSVYGILRVVLWVISVMLPPMAIFFPLFSVLEEFGILPRIAFNLDHCFEKCGACGKQALTCCMGIGCNVVGVSGTRIIDSPRERLIAIVTNSLVPCNGRFPLLIAIIAMFFSDNSALATVIMLAFLCLSLAMTMLSSFILSKTVLKGDNSPLVMEMPCYRAGNLFRIILSALKEKVGSVLVRAVLVTVPAGLVIWLLANITVNDSSLLSHLSSALDGVGRALGMDGNLLLAFILGFPANEIVLPVALMSYLSGAQLADYSSLSSLRQILVDNGWTTTTALCVCVFSMFHFPCSATLLTIMRETKSVRWTLLSVLLPLAIGCTLCALINQLFTFFVNIS